MPATELLSWAYMLMVQNLDADGRRKLDHALMPVALTVIDDPDLPESMQGVRPPSWWKDTPAEGTIRGLTV